MVRNRETSGGPRAAQKMPSEQEGSGAGVGAASLEHHRVVRDAP